MNKYTFMGNGRNKDFYFTFSFFSKGDIVVKINGTIATGYGVFCIQGTGNNDFPFTGGHIHFATAPKLTDIITMERKLQLNRIIDYQPTVELNPTTINQDMNYFFELLKDIKSDLAGFQETYAEFTDTESAQELLARINAVTEEIENLGDISTIRTNISELGTSVTNLTNSLNSLTSTVNTHTTNIGTNTNDITALKGYDYVIESQNPTAENNYTWYRKYKSGWVEQGGRVPGNTNGSYNITMPVEMADTNYNFIGTGYKDSNDAGFVAVCIDSSSVSTIGFRVYPRYAHNGSTGTPSQGGQWQVSGKSAN